MEGKEFKASRHLIALLLTAFVFLSGISLGAFLNTGQVSSLQSQMDSLKNSAEALDLQLLLADSSIPPERACPAIMRETDRLGAQLDELSGKLAQYESSRKFGESFSSLKADYTNLMVREWLFIRRAEKTCPGFSPSTVLYFYTNRDCPSCTGQGMVLDNEKEKLGQGIFIFPLDTDLSLPIVSALAEAYNVTEYPSLVVRDSPMPGFVGKEDLEKALGAGQ